ncbi:MAG: hypothetical protein ACJ74U_01985 [Jatrophihabitantaceae bacterium]
MLDQLTEAHPGQGWLSSPQTGTIGDTTHQAKNSSSDHNPWLNNVVRALDVAANVSDVAGIVTVSDAPDCEALFTMVNAMYAARDPRIWPDGYAIYLKRITDPDNPGSHRAHQGDPHLYHVHISVSRTQAGYNSTDNWPLTRPTPTIDPALTTGSEEDHMFHLIRNLQSGAVRACGPNLWVALEGPTDAETQANIALAAKLPGCASPTVEDVSDGKMNWLKRFYTTGKVTA